MKKLCGYQLALVFSFSLLGLLLCTSHALATDNIYQDGTDNYTYAVSASPANNFTISNTINSSCANSITLVYIYGYGGYPNPSASVSASYDGVAMTLAPNGFINYFVGSNKASWIYYLVGANTGTKNLHFVDSNDGGDHTVLIKTYCNVDQDTPFDYSVQTESPNYYDSSLDSGYFNITHNKSLVISDVSYRSVGDPFTSWTSGYTYSDYHWATDNNIRLGFFYNTVDAKITTDYYHFFAAETGCCSQKINLRLYVLNYKPNTFCGDTICQTATEDCSSCAADCGACSSAMVYLFGSPNIWDNPTVFKRNQVKSFPVFWNICSDFESVNRVILYSDLTWNFYDPGMEVVKDKTIYGSDQACKGNLIYSNYYTGFNNDATGTAYFHIKEYDASGAVIKTLTSNGHSWITDTAINYIDSAMKDPFYIDLGNLPQGVQTSTSTSLFFLYNFNGLNVASTTVGLYDYRNATSTGYYSIDTFNATTTGLAGIVMPTPTINTNNIYKFYAITPGQPVLWSKAFTVNWSFTAQTSDVYTDLECTPNMFDDSHICDGIDQTTSDGFSTLFGHNWGSIRCASIYATNKTAFFFFTPSCNSMNSIKRNFDEFKGAFPFSAFFSFTDAMDNAIKTATTSTTTTSTIDIPFVHRIGATSTNKFYTLPVLTTSSVSNLIGTDNKNVFRLTLGYLVWLVVAFVIIVIMRKI
jgi:hypothetical protein